MGVTVERADALATSPRGRGQGAHAAGGVRGRERRRPPQPAQLAPRFRRRRERLAGAFPGGLAVAGAKIFFFCG